LQIPGDLGFVNTEDLMTPFDYDAHMTNDRKKFSKLLSQDRIGSEWGFGQMVQLFALLLQKSSLKMKTSDPDKFWMVCFLLRNFHITFNGCQHTFCHNIAPPNSHEYLSFVRNAVQEF
jgi:hypothetical protein